MSLQDTDRFAFGRNWQRFLSTVNDDRIAAAEAGLRAMLGLESLAGRSFLDVGSGSGLASLAAMRLGAARVHSFDYDAQSVACTREMKRRYFHEAEHWTVEKGSALDRGYLESLGQFDIVYSWGVLHHTGNMWAALEDVIIPVRPGGTLFIAIYSDQAGSSRRWLAVKKLYNRAPRPVRWAILLAAFGWIWGQRCLRDLLHGRLFRTWTDYHRTRGMSPWYDVVDWVGGYPFEVARPEEIFRFYKARGFDLLNLTTSGGCNEFVFSRSGACSEPLACVAGQDAGHDSGS